MPSPYPASPAWPGDWAACTFRGKLITISADPTRVSGIYLSPNVSQVLKHLSSKTVVTVEPLQVPVNPATGEFEVLIPATDDPHTQPSPWRYLCRIVFGSGDSRKNIQFEFDAPAGSVVDLADLAPFGQSVTSGQALTVQALASVLRAGANMVKTVDGESQTITLSSVGGGTGGGGGSLIEVKTDPSDSRALILSDPVTATNARLSPPIVAGSNVTATRTGDTVVVDVDLSSKASLSGATFTAPITVPPGFALGHAVTKEQMETAVGVVAAEVAAIASAANVASIDPSDPDIVLIETSAGGPASIDPDDADVVLIKIA